MENEYKISFDDFLEHKKGSIRQRYCEVDGFIFGHDMVVSSFCIMNNEEIIASVKADEEGKITFANVFVNFLNKVSSDLQIMKNIQSYSMKDRARRFTLMTNQQYNELLHIARDKGEEKAFKNRLRAKKFISNERIFYLSADVNICEQMEFCCEIVPVDKRKEWFFCATPVFESAYSKEFKDKCDKLDKKIKRNRKKGIQEINKAYINSINQDKKKKPRTSKQGSKVSLSRNPIIVSMAKIIADGMCELCDANGVFHKAPIFDGYGPYLEVHHIVWLAKEGTDTIDNVVALCPTCHRKMHIVASKDDVKCLKKNAKLHKKKWEKIVEEVNGKEL